MPEEEKLTYHKNSFSCDQVEKLLKKKTKTKTKTDFLKHCNQTLNFKKLTAILSKTDTAKGFRFLSCNFSLNTASQGNLICATALKSIK